MSKFKVGQRVKCLHPGINGVVTLGRFAIVREVDSPRVTSPNSIVPAWEDIPGWAYPINGWAYSDMYWELAPNLFDPDKPITTRDGRSVVVTRTNDPARPFEAEVSGLRLTFDPSGQFYPGFEQPIDLVNA